MENSFIIFPAPGVVGDGECGGERAVQDGGPRPGDHGQGLPCHGHVGQNYDGPDSREVGPLLNIFV